MSQFARNYIEKNVLLRREGGTRPRVHVKPGKLADRQTDIYASGRQNPVSDPELVEGLPCLAA